MSHMSNGLTTHFLEKYPFDLIVSRETRSHTDIINPHFPCILSCIVDEWLRYRSEQCLIPSIAADQRSNASDNWYHSVIGNVYEPIQGKNDHDLSIILKGYQYEVAPNSGFSYVSLAFPPLWSKIRERAYPTESGCYNRCAESCRPSLLSEDIQPQNILCRIQIFGSTHHITLISGQERKGSPKAFRLRKILV